VIASGGLLTEPHPSSDLARMLGMCAHLATGFLNNLKLFLESYSYIKGRTLLCYLVKVNLKLLSSRGKATGSLVTPNARPRMLCLFLNPYNAITCPYVIFVIFARLLLFNHIHNKL